MSKRLRTEEQKARRRAQYAALSPARHEAALAKSRAWHAAADKDKLRARNAAYRKAHPEQAKASSLRWYYAHHDEVKARRRAYYSTDEWKLKKWETCRGSRQRLRKAVVASLGGKCARCGFSDVRALQIDHKNGGGCREYKSMTIKAYHLRVLERGSAEYQLLCANCNIIKKFENGEGVGFGSMKREGSRKANG